MFINMWGSMTLAAAGQLPECSRQIRLYVGALQLGTVFAAVLVYGVPILISCDSIDCMYEAEQI